MIRTILVLCLLANTLAAQDENTTLRTDPLPLNQGQAIGVGAAKAVADLEARIRVLEQLTSEYQPSWTWPGSNGPQPFEALRKHMNGEVIHPARDVSKWTARELAFVHDQEHVEEYLAADKALPVLKDQRLRDWVRAKNPAKALPRKLGRSVKRIVMHTMSNCGACEQWKRDSMPLALAEGVEVVPVDEGRGISGQSYPYFDIEYCKDDQCQRLRVVNEPFAAMKNRLMRMNN